MDLMDIPVVVVDVDNHLDVVVVAVVAAAVACEHSSPDRCHTAVVLAESFDNCMDLRRTDKK